MHRRYAANLPLTLSALVVLAAPQGARAERDVVGARATAMGGALRASASGNAGILLNPAGMSLTRTYVVGSQYQFRGADRANKFTATIVDSITTRVAAGLSYTYMWASPERVLALPEESVRLDESHKAHDFNFALSVPLGEWLTIGTSGRYVNYKVSLPEDTPEEIRGADISDFTMDAGAVVRLGQLLRIAVVGHNLIPADSQLYPQSLGMGAAVSFGQLTAEFDTVLDFDSDPEGLTTVYQGGLEAFLADRYALRGGVMHQTYWGATHISFGAGVVTRRVGVEFALRQQVDGGKATLFTLSLNMYAQ
jgi:hypothetical protein